MKCIADQCATFGLFPPGHVLSSSIYDAKPGRPVGYFTPDWWVWLHRQVGWLVAPTGWLVGWLVHQPRQLTNFDRQNRLTYDCAAGLALPNKAPDLTEIRSTLITAVKRRLMTQASMIVMGVAELPGSIWLIWSIWLFGCVA
jgi:hypothetical protein